MNNLYYFKYNNVDLSDIAYVREVEMPSLPTMSHSSIEMFERDGAVYNGMSYDTRFTSPSAHPSPNSVITMSSTGTHHMYRFSSPQNSLASSLV